MLDRAHLTMFFDQITLDIKGEVDQQNRYLDSMVVDLFFVHSFSDALLLRL